MVPLSERRHRLHTPEIPEVKRGLKLRLRELCEAWEDEESAEIVYRIFIRLNTGKPGRPKYLEFSWDMVQRYLDWHEDE